MRIRDASSNRNLSNLIPSLTKLPNNLIKLEIDSGSRYMPLSFLVKLTNLQELILSYDYRAESFKELQHAIFPQLRILKFKRQFPNLEYLIKFLENNGRNLKEIYLAKTNNSLNLDIQYNLVKPNLR